MFNLNLHQVVFAVSLIIITATILNGALTASSIQIVVAEQKGRGNPTPAPEPDCSIYTLDGRKIFVPCPTTPPPAVDTTKTKSLLSNNAGIADEPLQTSPSSPIKSDRGTITGERLAEEEPMQFSTSNEENR